MRTFVVGPSLVILAAFHSNPAVNRGNASKRCLDFTDYSVGVGVVGTDSGQCA